MSPQVGGADVGLTIQGKRLADILNAEFSIRNPVVGGWRADGSNVYLRFIARTPWVQVHVQSTEPGEGGITYVPDQFSSSTEVDCRENRQQDVVVPELPDGRYIIYLIPVEYDAADTKILFDGKGGRPDYMSFADIGTVASDELTTAEKWSVLHLGNPGRPPIPADTLTEGDQAALSGLYAGIDYS